VRGGFLCLVPVKQLDKQLPVRDLQAAAHCALLFDDEPVDQIFGVGIAIAGASTVADFDVDERNVEAVSGRAPIDRKERVTAGGKTIGQQHDVVVPQVCGNFGRKLNSHCPFVVLNCRPNIRGRACGHQLRSMHRRIIVIGRGGTVGGSMQQKAWVVEKDRIELLIGSSSADIKLTTEVTVAN
jgi:hypothetical protein